MPADRGLTLEGRTVRKQIVVRRDELEIALSVRDLCE
jgi:hypothetical protein